MAEHFFDIPADDQRDILNTAAVRLGKTAQILEKDLWVCWALQQLFSIPGTLSMAFKGGTSLSKVFGVIDRFSEDIDITVNFRELDGTFDPFDGDASRSAIDRYSDKLKQKLEAHISSVILPALLDSAGSMPSHFNVRVEHDGETVHVHYNSLVDQTHGYMKDSVLIEFGGRNETMPGDTHNITTDTAPIVPALQFPVADVHVLSAERTFWEKATLVHSECNKGRLKQSPERLSRHWHDLCQLADHDIGKSALQNRKLLEDVLRIKKTFYRSATAKYDECLNGRLRIIPDEDGIQGLRRDYEEMHRTGMLSSDAPEFDQMMQRLKNLERNINGTP